MAKDRILTKNLFMNQLTLNQFNIDSLTTVEMYYISGDSDGEPKKWVKGGIWV